MRLVLAGVLTTATLALGAASATAALPQAPALPAAGSAAGSAASAAQSTASAAESTANAALGAAGQQADKGVAAARQATSRLPTRSAPAVPAAPALPRPHVAAPRAPAVPHAALPEPPDALSAPPAATQAIEVAGRETSAYRKKLVPHSPQTPRIEPLGGLAALVGDTLGNALRQIAPSVGTLLAPVQPLLSDLRVGFGLPNLVAVLAPGEAQTLGATAERHSVPAAPPAAPPATTAPPAPVAAAAPDGRAHAFQAASARPPAAEVGGRPVSPLPWTAPAPVAGGAAPSSSGGIFVPLLGLLVLAALAAPRLLRRLDELPAFVRPEPFLCALERPG